MEVIFIYLGEVTKKYREEHEPKLSFRDFAAISGLSHSYIRHLEKPENFKVVAATDKTLKKIASAVGIEYQTLIDMLENKQKVTFGHFDDKIQPEVYEIMMRIKKSPRAIRLFSRASADLTSQKLKRLEQAYNIVEATEVKLGELEKLFEIMDFTPEKLQDMKDIIIFLSNEPHNRKKRN